ncbi:glutamine-hydrolyzing GMP synthase [bacterium]|jgi:GMP synthase (glutamine-hydrolysing)|nr:glutamine-hydrolyzing GMP synthase [bacterium]MBT6831470.1 glutamine-hydrolyzing GMP synthase [bacterium]MBT6996495.1 glutamine-hydrolyzing GMP synthase [bacterium]MBT7772703.1 glutamine-hydrolyzing GMP synthase [bacterium]
MNHEKIIILDFGGQYAHLIASRIRRLGVLAEIMLPRETTATDLADDSIRGIILSGGPQSVFADDSPQTDNEIFALGKPVLGLCYGHQYFAQALGGKVAPGTTGEFGRSEFTQDGKCPIFKNVPEKSVVWMNHVDAVETFAPGFEICGTTPHCATAAAWDSSRNFFSLQCHVEVTHTEFGEKMLENFLDLCGCSRDWSVEKFYQEQEKKLLEKVGDKNVFLFVSGGVDSTVTFALLTKVLGADRVRGLFVDTGLLRQGEVSQVEKSIRAIGADLTTLREADYFLKKLAGQTDPEQKRETIGHAFLDVQQEFFKKNGLDESWLLAQGTIYPDTIESGGTKNAAKIKTHHNRAPEVQKLIDAGKVIEPVAELYKDEVRALGELLGLPHELVWRHPFPGPGLGVRILCSDENFDETLVEKIDAFTMQPKKRPFVQLPIKSVGVQGDFRTYRHPAVLTSIPGEKTIDNLEKFSTKLINHYDEINRCTLLLGKNYDGNISKISVKKCDLSPERVARLQAADAVVTRLLREMNAYEKVWQFPVVLLPIFFNSVGSETIVLRPVDSIDAMSASVGKLSWEFFDRAAKEILENDPEISAVLLDCTSKPPGTIEWE